MFVNLGGGSSIQMKSYDFEMWVIIVLKKKVLNFQSAIKFYLFKIYYIIFIQMPTNFVNKLLNLIQLTQYFLIYSCIQSKTCFFKLSTKYYVKMTHIIVIIYKHNY